MNNRLTRDSTAPRRPSAKRTPSPEPRPEQDAAVAAEAELIRVAWAQPFRITSF
jgi:hypothetical protein